MIRVKELVWVWGSGDNAPVQMSRRVFFMECWGDDPNSRRLAHELRVRMNWKRWSLRGRRGFLFEERDLSSSGLN